MAILRSSHKAGKTTPKGKSFKELLSRLGQCSQLAAPKYADSTKLMNGFVWGRWTQSCQKVYDESNYFTSPDPIDVYKNHIHYEVVRSFLEWSCQISRFTSSASLFTYARVWRMSIVQYTRSPVDPAIKMDMKNFIMDTLIDQFGLKQTGRFRGVVNRSVGKETFEFKMLRRGAAAALPEEVRSQAMGHVNSSIYERSYRNQVVDVDIVSAFLETPSDEALIKLMGHMSLIRDPNAPAEPTSAQRREV